MIIRTETHLLKTNAADRATLVRTIQEYRRLVRVLCGIFFVHYKELSEAQDCIFVAERLFHATRGHPSPRYAVIDRMFHKFPSYLRRAAIHAAFGAMSSYLSNYDRWVTGRRRHPHDQPPRPGVSNVFPPLYGGQCIRLDGKWSTAAIKVLRPDGSWGWTAPLKVRGRLKRILSGQALSATLVVRGAKAYLACPVKHKPAERVKSKKVCSVDVGINTAATAAIVAEDGTVIARKFITCGRHNDQRDKLATQVAVKARQSKKLYKGFCKGLYRRIAGLNRDAARRIAKELVDFALEHGAEAFAFEHLKGWRPKGPKRSMRLRFHRFLHRAIVRQVSFKAQEFGLKMGFVNPRGTSAWAYDGSGEVTRDAKNYSLCVFPSGKRYNADLNAAYNIAARYWASVVKLPLVRPAAGKGRSSCPAPRMPVCLSDLWLARAA